jgi:hypothetical protein
MSSDDGLNPNENSFAAYASMNGIRLIVNFNGGRINRDDVFLTWSACYLPHQLLSHCRNHSASPISIKNIAAYWTFGPN